MRIHQVVFSGSGGQGLMFIGKLLAREAIEDYPHITFFPSYGAEVRGGTSNCQVILSDEPISSPLVEHGTVQVLMNQPSVDKFLHTLADGGKAYVNSTMASAKGDNVVLVPAIDIANEVGNVQSANVVLFAAMLSQNELLPREKILNAILKLSERKGEKVVELNRQAFEKGWAFGEKA